MLWASFVWQVSYHHCICILTVECYRDCKLPRLDHNVGQSCVDLRCVNRRPSALKNVLTPFLGASGITGWAITNALIEGYPDDSTFSQITALTNRALTPEAAQWPSSKKLQVVSGLDLLTSKGQEGLEAEMKEKVKGIETVTHVYFFGRSSRPANKCNRRVMASSIYHGFGSR